MATKNKTELKPGDYVQIKKGLIGVVTGVEKETNFDGPYDEKTGSYLEVATGFVYVESVDATGESENNQYETKKLTKIKAPEYVVVWTDEYSDPFTQFATKPEADKFAAKLRKNKDVVEIRIYKLTK